jgi:hypothetical protein
VLTGREVILGNLCLAHRWTCQLRGAEVEVVGGGRWLESQALERSTHPPSILGSLTGDKSPPRLSRPSYGSISSLPGPAPQPAPCRETYLSEKIPIPSADQVGMVGMSSVLPRSYRILHDLKGWGGGHHL